MKKITLKIEKKYLLKKPFKATVLSKKNDSISIFSASKIAFVFVGTILGAGFAGGRELVTFFVRFEKGGVFSSILAGLMFLILGTAIIYKAKLSHCTSYSQYLKIILPKKASYFLSAISEMFLFICFIIMLSGSGALFNECFGTSEFFGSITTSLIVFFIFKKGMDGIGTACSFMTPLMIAGIIFVDIYSLTTNSIQTSMVMNIEKNNFILSALLYVSYNLLSSAPVLVEASTLAPNKKTSAAGGIIGGVLLSIIAFFSCLALYLTDSESLLSELPLLMLSGKINSYFHSFYALILYMAILTTALSTGFPIVKKIESLSISSSKASLLLCLTALPLSCFKFSLLVEKCYTLFGALGLILISAILLDLLKIKRRYQKKNKEFKSKRPLF